MGWRIIQSINHLIDSVVPGQNKSESMSAPLHSQKYEVQFSDDYFDSEVFLAKHDTNNMNPLQGDPELIEWDEELSDDSFDVAKIPLRQVLIHIRMRSYVTELKL